MYSLPGTPYTTQGKRELSSPEDRNDPKNSRAIPEADSHQPDDTHVGPVTNITLDQAAYSQIVTAIKESVQGEIERMMTHNLESVVNSIVDGVLSGIQTKVASLESEMITLKDENASLRDRVSHLESVCDASEQYSRRNNLRITGVRESESENTDLNVLKLCETLKLTSS